MQTVTWVATAVSSLLVTGNRCHQLQQQVGEEVVVAVVAVVVVGDPGFTRTQGMLTSGQAACNGNSSNAGMKLLLLLSFTALFTVPIARVPGSSPSSRLVTERMQAPPLDAS